MNTNSSKILVCERGYYWIINRQRIFFVTRIWLKISRMLRVNTRMDLNTNAGTLTSRQQCTVPDFKNFKVVWFNEKAMTNILSFAKVRDLVCPLLKYQLLNHIQLFNPTFANDRIFVIAISLNYTALTSLKFLKSGTVHCCLELRVTALVFRSIRVLTLLVPNAY